jgi:uncharacterized protein with GYD domain
MRLNRNCLALLLILSFPSQSAERGPRHFMFIGEPSAAAWKYLMENPADRQKEVEAGMAAIGGKVLSYYFGLGDGKNYITVVLPDDNEVIQAVYLMRLPTGLLNSYQVIELMPSAKMAQALRKSAEFIELEKTTGGGVE